MSQPSYREKLIEYVRKNAKPPDKFTQQERLYGLARRLAVGNSPDDDVIFAAVWLHDLGVFIGHRPEEPDKLAAWDCVAYAMDRAPAVLANVGFPKEKIAAVVEVIRTHQPSAEPASFEAAVVRDADILEQLGAVGILRTVSKVGRDTRFILFSDALRVLRKNVEELPGKLRLERAKELAKPRILALNLFLTAVEAEGAG